MKEIHQKIKNAKRIVFKFGTNCLSREDGSLSMPRIYSFIEDLADLKNQGKEIILVTSGAVGLGSKRLNMEKPSDIILKQACAAVGQSRLMYLYEEGFEKYGVISAQVLLTEEDFGVRRRYLNLRNTLNELLTLGVIPIINQNDTVSASGVVGYNIEGVKVCFGDNDKLSALVASELGADLLVILSDIDGLYDDDPRVNKDAKLIPVVHEVTEEIEKLGFDASSKGRGGMKTKLEAAKVVTNSGGMAIVSNGKKSSAIRDIFTKNETGTVFLSTDNLSGKKRWIAYATNVIGKIVINEGAIKALAKNNASLLPIGVEKVINKFQAGDVVSILNENQEEIARGIVNYSSKDCSKIMGKHSDDMEKILGYKNYDAIITRDNIVLL